MRRGIKTFAIFERPILAAGMFADGTTIGDTALLNRLTLRRCNMLPAVETDLEMLSDAGGHNAPPRQLIEQFRTLADSVSHWYLPPEVQLGRSLYHSIMKLPEELAGSPLPPTIFVAQETAALNRQRLMLSGSQSNLADTAR